VRAVAGLAHEPPVSRAHGPARSRTEVFLRYLGYCRSRVISKCESLSGDELRRSRLPSGWTPLELVKHLRPAGWDDPVPGRRR